jgi:hypothetical protein
MYSVQGKGKGFVDAPRPRTSKRRPEIWSPVSNPSFFFLDVAEFAPISSMLLDVDFVSRDLCSIALNQREIHERLIDLQNHTTNTRRQAVSN